MPKIIGRRTFRKIRNNYAKLETKSVKEIRALVEKLRLELASELAISNWSLVKIDEIKMLINSLTLQFQNAAMTSINGSLEKAFIKGIKQVDDVLMSTKDMVIMPYLDREILEISQSMAADLITNISSEMANKINTQIRLALMGNETPLDAMKKLESFLPPLRNRKWTGTIPGRAENIVRTEMSRVNNTANLERMKMVAEKNPEYGKQWLGSHKPTSRPAHTAKEDLGVVPMDYEYTVNGYKCNGPHDPRLPASEVCMCGCTLVLKKLPEDQIKKAVNF